MNTRALTVVLLFSAPLVVLACAGIQRRATPTTGTIASEMPSGGPAPSTGAPSLAETPPAGASGPAARPAPPPGPTKGTAMRGSGELLQKGEIKVTKQVYQETFDDIHALIAELNTIIQRKDYAAWLTHLTSAYRAWYSDPRNLKEISNEPILHREGIELHSLDDYFNYVVVPSRADAHLDDLDFVEPNHVKAITIIDGQRYILYDLRHQGSEWKIGVSS